MKEHKNNWKLTRRIVLVFLITFLLSISLMTTVTSAELITDLPLNEEFPDIPPGYIIIEGDIQVPEEWLSRSPDAVWDTALWPNGIVPYIFDANVNPANQQNMLAAMAEWKNVANVDFIPRNGHANYVRIQNSTGNNSAVGMQGGEQIINIFNWNSRFIMAHELAHTLGLWHEQSRSDRNDYIQINTGNIAPGHEDNFDMHAEADVYPKQAYGLADEQTYDFDSVMHYSQCAFSVTTCPPTTTITVLPPNQTWQSLIGQRDHLSDLDQLTMSFLYAENNWNFVDRTHGGSQSGTFLNPYTSFTYAYNQIPSNDVLWIQPGTYAAVGTYDKPMTLRAPLGNVVLGP